LICKGLTMLGAPMPMDNTERELLDSIKGTLDTQPTEYPDISNDLYALLIGIDQRKIMSFIDDAYEDLREELEKHGFSEYSRGVYFGPLNTVNTVVVAQDLKDKLWWFHSDSVISFYMIRIEEISDLSRVLS